MPGRIVWSCVLAWKLKEFQEIQELERQEVLSEMKRESFRNLCILRNGIKDSEERALEEQRIRLREDAQREREFQEQLRKEGRERERKVRLIH